MLQTDPLQPPPAFMGGTIQQTFAPAASEPDTAPPKTAVSHTKEHFLPFLQFSVQSGVKQLPHYSHTPNSLLLEFTSALLQLYNICIIKMSAKEAKKNSFLFRGSSVVKMMSSESAKLISCGYILQEIQEAQLSC